MPDPKRPDQLTTVTPATTDYLVVTPTGGPAGKSTIASVLALGGGGGVSSLNSLTGALSIAAGTNITVTPAGSSITIASTGGSSTKTVNAQTGTTYTLALGDANNIVTMSNTSAITLTIPPNSSVAFAVGTELEIIQLNTGQVTITNGVGVTINATPGKKLRARYSGCGLIQVAADSWIVVGDTTP